MKDDQQDNLFDDLLYKLESQIKNTESEIESKKNIALSEIVIIIETADSVKEIIKFEKQYDEIEKKFNQEIILQREKIKKNFTFQLDRLIKYLKKSKP